MKKLILLALLTAVLTPAYAQYAFTPLQFPGANRTATRGINNHGQIVGSYRIVAPGHAMLLDKGNYIPLAPSSVLGSDPSFATGINDFGQIVGSYSDGDGIHGFRFSGGAISTLDFPGTNGTTEVNGINDCGTIVGLFGVHGFTLTGGAYTQIDVPGAAETNVQGVNCRGDIVGLWDTDFADIGFGFVRTKSGQFISFEVPGSAPHSTQANSINDLGQIVGLYIDNTGSFRGFLAVGSTFTTINVPGADSTVCWQINNAGQIVGNYTVGGVTSGFLATPIPSQKP